MRGVIFRIGGGMFMNSKLYKFNIMRGRIIRIGGEC